MDLKRIYNSFENNNIPEQNVKKDRKGRINEFLIRSLRGDVIICEHTNNQLYKSIRVAKKTQSHSSAIHDMVKDPQNRYNEDFEYCEYQLLTVSFDSFREKNANFNQQLVHNKCKWNSANATRLQVARSAKQLQTVWENYS